MDRSTANAGSAHISQHKPWYTHRWPWLLMLGPLAVVFAGTYTIWIAFTMQDALVVDDYYKQGKAINQDLSRDREATARKMTAQLRYDVAQGRLLGQVQALGASNNTTSNIAAIAEPLRIRLIHSTLPEKDLQFDVLPDAHGNFSVPLNLLEIARWQVVIENQARNWRLLGTWKWPQEKQLSMAADAVPASR